MSLWEYKVITSGKGGFATPALLEKFLNDLGRDEWEIINYATQPDNPLSFSGLARRSTQRDWTLQDAAAVAAKAEAEKLRAEFEAKFKAATTTAPAAAEPQALSYLEEKAAPDDGFRKPVDTSRDDEPDAPDEEEKDDWDKLDQEDELPTFFDALKPHMRRNQRGPGMSAGVDFLAKKWDLAEEDVKGALVECGFQIPADENAKPVYIEYDGDLYWVNINRRGEIWINTREKPRPVFRIVQGNKVAPEESAEPANGGNRKPAPAEATAGKPDAPASAEYDGAAEAVPSETFRPKSQQPSKPLPTGPELLEKIRPHMRRNRRGPGGSGSTSFLARALRTTEAELISSFGALGLSLPEKSGDQPVYAEFGAELWWLNKDQRGGVWINGREKQAGETAATAAANEAAAVETTGASVASAAPAAEAAPAPKADTVFPAVRLLLKPGKTGTFAGETEKLAGELGKPVEDFIATLTSLGLKVPEKAREKPVFVEHAGEIFWFNRNAKGQLWLNAKASKFAEGDAAEKPKRGRGRKADAGKAV
jgi:hypothetical protein